MHSDSNHCISSLANLDRLTLAEICDTLTLSEYIYTIQHYIVTQAIKLELLYIESKLTYDTYVQLQHLLLCIHSKDFRRYSTRPRRKVCHTQAAKRQ